VFDSGDKYGMIALPSVLVGPDVPDRVDLGGGLWTATRLPLGLPDHWREWIGSLRARTLAEGDLFLVASGPSEHPGVLDAENELYVTQAYDLYLGLHVTDVVVAHESPYRLTGANRDGDIDVRSIGELRVPHWVFGTPLTRLSQRDLEAAAIIAGSVAETRTAGGFERLGRALRAFYDGIHDDRVDERIHQFLRCVEGFVIPEPGRTLARLRSRTEAFLGPGHHERVGEWFDIRSAVEHLHVSHDSVPGGSLRDRLVRVMRMAWEVECLARDCLRRVLSDPELRDWFATDDRLGAFWELDEAERRELWGDPMDIEAAEAAFDERFIADQDLGL